MATSERSVRLPHQTPYEWASILHFLTGRAIPGIEVVEGDRYLRTVALEHEGQRVRGALAVEQDSAAALRLRTWGLPESVLPDVVRRVRGIFDLDADPALIAKQLGKSRVLKPLLARHPGLRVPGAWDGFELAVRGILGQQITVVGATRLAGKLVAIHGTPLGIDVHERLTHVFPSPAELAVADLSMLGMPGARRAALLSLGARVASDPSLFATGDALVDTVRRLCELPGIGEWTAQYIAMRALRQPDAFLAADVGLHRAMARPDGTRPKPKELLALAEAWRPYRAYATLHLWTSLKPVGDDAKPKRATKKKAG